MVGIDKALEIEGWTTPAELGWLRKMALGANSGALIVEVGSWKGRSTVALAVDHARLFCVDTFQGSPSDETGELARKEFIYGIFDRNMARLGLHPWVIAKPSVVAARRFVDRSVAMLFLDADKTQLEADLDAWLPRVEPGGIVAGHDYHDPRWPNVPLALKPYRPFVVPDTSIWWFGKGAA